MDDRAQLEERRRRERAAAGAAAANARALAAGDRLLVELEERLWLDDFARALVRSRGWWGGRWCWN
jgi:hypothetical protein